jgi:23S rRNA pseudouridine2605 synthase
VTEERLQKVLAAAGVASRRGAEALISAGRVTVDGRVARLGERVDPSTAIVAVDGRPIQVGGPRVHLALHKPAGVTSTVRDRHAGRTVLELVPVGLVRPGTRIYPVGRLDRDSEGLLLLTDDGPWADRVLHPRYGVHREYLVGVDRSLEAAALGHLRSGVTLDDGPAHALEAAPASADRLRAVLPLLDPPPHDLHWYRLVLREGRKRQVRRMFAALGVHVRRLVRTRIGPLMLDGLPSGAVRTLAASEIEALAGTDES